MRIDSSGNVGIGTAIPSDKLHIEGGGLRLEEDGGVTISYREATTGNAELIFRDSKAAIDRLKIDSDGRLLVGTQSSSLTATAVLTGNSAGASSAPTMVFARDFTPSAINQSLGELNFYGASNGLGARIIATSDAAWGAGSLPTALAFRTTPSGSSNSVERMRITNGGRVQIADSGSYYDYGASLSVSTSSNVDLHTGRATNASFASKVLFYYTSRAASNAYEFLRFASAGATDPEFRLVGDGNAYADGSWSGGGADYAEFFEWSDGNAAAEDRRGISVVLDGDKIREAVAGEEPIGAISGNPSVVGDADIQRWKGKYLRDDFGTYIQEDYEVEDEDGNSVTQQRRKLNPAYDPDVEYVSRENRPEWDCVGLMGKLRIRKGQVTGTRWIKMRDISDSVEEWLVR
jgi:hypothetical protein